MSKIKHITIIGDGGWGTALAIHLAQQGAHVKIWGPYAKYLAKMRQTRINKKFLPNLRIPDSVEFVEQLSIAVYSSDLVVFAVPSKYARDVLTHLKKTKTNFSKKIFLSVTKGVDTTKLQRITEIIREQLGDVTVAVLSGPNIASEVAKKIPSSAVVASKNAKVAKMIQETFNTPTFRIYTNTDVIGVELGGSIKNIIAIACGVCDGLGYGTNTKAALLTRGLAEMARLGKKLGGKLETFSGLSGLGDLVTTSFNLQSRNRSVGQKLGEGKTIKQITSKMDMVAEGVETAKAVYNLSKKYKIPMPITTEVYNIIYKNKKPQQAVLDLMHRKTKSE